MDSHASAAVAAAATLLLVVGCLLARRAYPRPLPGIPYNRAAAGRLLGDMADMAETVRRGGSFRTWFVTQAARHDSAMTQVFLGPFAKPAVVVSDYREVSDILRHRDGVDFKRGLKVEAFGGLLPHAFPAMETFDARFRESRELARDLMTPAVLHAVNAPRIHGVACDLVDLWCLKRRLAGGRPFDVAGDVSEFSFDAILSAAVGLGAGGGDVRRQLEHLAGRPAGRAGAGTEARAGADADADDPAVFDAAPTSAELAALREQEASLWKAFVVPWPRLYHALNGLRPRARAARATLRRHMAAQAARARARLARAGEQPRCALDFVMQRELRAAARQARAPALDDARVLEPVHGYLVAGHDTSAGALLWLLRRLMLHRRCQARLRADLAAAFPEARAGRRLPSAPELVAGRRAPWLDAFVHETLRLDAPVVNIMVMTRCDTVVLGHAVPADTRVFLNLAGPSISLPSVAVDEARRSPTSRARASAPPPAPPPAPAPAPRADWDDADPAEFRPERWLRADADGRPLFDAALGPHLAFSAGNRGCWGKRLGYLELRIVVALLVWSFEFELPAKFVRWDTYDSLVTAPKQCLVRLRELPR